jgi:hypothetical protein
LLDFFVFKLGDSLVLSVADSLLGDFSVFASAFSDFLVLLFFSLDALVLFDDGLVALSAAGLFVAAGLLVVDGDFVGANVPEGIGLVLALADGVMVAAADAEAAGVMVAPTVAAGVALALVEAALVGVVPVVVAVVPLVAVTPTLKLGLTP